MMIALIMMPVILTNRVVRENIDIVAKNTTLNTIYRYVR